MALSSQQVPVLHDVNAILEHAVSSPLLNWWGAHPKVSHVAVSSQREASLHEEVAVPKHFTLTPLLISVFGQVNLFQAAFASQLRPIAPEMMPVYPAWACAHTNAIVVEALGVQILRASAGGALVTIAVACLAGAPNCFVTAVTKHTVI